MASNDDVYANTMPRDEDGIKTIDQQYKMVTEYVALLVSFTHLCLQALRRALGWTLYPGVAERLGPKCAIADVATGTGAFIVSLAGAYPDPRLDGYDISSDMFPSPNELPSNVHLYTANAKKPFESSLKGQYDLFAGMTPADWELVVVNLLHILKPGGAVQWVEPSLERSIPLREEPDSTVSTLRKVSETFFQNDDFQRRCAFGWSALPGIMMQAGLLVERDVVSSDRVAGNRRILTENDFGSVMRLARRLTAQGLMGGTTMAEIEETEEGLRKDIASGGYIRYDIHTAVGFKTWRTPQFP